MRHSLRHVWVSSGMRDRLQQSVSTVSVNALTIAVYSMVPVLEQSTKRSAAKTQSLPKAVDYADDT